MIKRTADIFLSFVGLVFLSPAIIILILLVRFHLGTPVFFKQDRPGLHGKIFKMIKFRTMRNTLDNNGKLLPDSLRLTKLGNFMRATSLDELPELWNVLKGDMSMVGPRPLLIEYLPLYSNTQSLRHNVRPGITGWAQVNGRNAISWEEKFNYDIWYVENQTFFFDMKIILMTIRKVIKREGIYAGNKNFTMPKFTGSNDTIKK